VTAEPAPDSQREKLVSLLRTAVAGVTSSPAEGFVLLAAALSSLPAGAGEVDAREGLERVLEGLGPRGTAALLEDWYERKRRMLVDRACRSCGLELAEQLAADTLSTVLAGGAKYRGTGTVDRFLRGVLQTKRMALARESGRMWGRILLRDPDTHEWRAPERLSRAERREIRAAVDECVRRARERLGGDFDGASFLEAIEAPRGYRRKLAASLDMTPGGLAGHVSRTRKLVIECLEAKGIRP
jgi:hypothetical protein